MDLSRRSIEDVYSEYVVFSNAGTHPNRMAFCPLHGEVAGTSKPSLCINVETGAWICFAGCGGGGLQQFLLKSGEAEHTVKDKTKNIQISKPRKKKRRAQTEFLPNHILGLFEHCPIELINDGFDEEVLQYHDIGFDINKCRITYPVINKDKKLLAIVGRRNDTTYGKYVPYTEKELRDYGVEVFPKYEKGSVFWREDKYFETLSCRDRTTPVIIVEGFKAALWLVQHGYNNVMALMGTHLTDYHISTLEGLGKKIILCLDGDIPGIKSTIKNGYKLGKTMQVLACHYKRGATQPDDIKDAEELHELVSKPITISKYKKLHKDILENGKR